MEKPKLQLALDMPDLVQALKVSQKAAADIDVIEAGTMLVLEEGMKAVRYLRALFPFHLILADIRIIKAGGKLAAMAFDAGADWVTVMSDASKDTIEAVVNESRKRLGTDVQVEINVGYDDEKLAYLRSLGIRQLIYHRSSEVVDTEEKWDKKTLEELKRLSNMGFELSITGGLDISEIPLFKDISVYCFIAGRKICKAEDPEKAALSYQNTIKDTFLVK